MKNKLFLTILIIGALAFVPSMVRASDPDLSVGQLKSMAVNLVNTTFVNGVFPLFPIGTYGQLQMMSNFSGGLRIRGIEYGGNPNGALSLEGFSNTDGWVGDPIIRLVASQIGDPGIGNIVEIEKTGKIVSVQNKDSEVLSIGGDGSITAHGAYHALGVPTVQSASELVLTRNSNTFFVSGSSQIVGIALNDQSNLPLWNPGDEVTLIFKDKNLLWHGGVNGQQARPLFLGGSINAKIPAQSTMSFVFDGGYWREKSRITP